MSNYSYSWTFQELRKSDMNVDPVADEFFATEELKGLSDALVRESIQNSLDARVAPKKPVTVRFNLSGVNNPVEPEVSEHYLYNLKQHLETQNSNFVDIECLNDPMTYIVIEDFNTRGLTGDETQYKDNQESNGEKNNFYYFWRNIGRSKKHETDRGRWGLGKTVFPASSRIHSFFGLTARNDDEKIFLMGQSVLKTHEHTGKRYSPYGYYAEIDDEDFQLPVDDSETINDFKENFSLARLEESGLSVVIPYPRAEINGSAIIRSVLLHYFYPILAEDLIVEVLDENNNLYKIDASSIKSFLNVNFDSQDSQLETTQLLKIIELAEYSLTISDEQLNLLNEGTHAYSNWSGETFEISVEELRIVFESGERLAFKVPVKVNVNEKTTELTYFKVFMEHAGELSQGSSYFIRGGLTIPKVGKFNSVKFVRGLVIIDEPLISNLLGDSENPAHTAWEPRRNKLSGKYKYAEQTIRYVKSSLAEITKKISRPPEGRDEDLLKNIFFLELPPEDGSKTPKPDPRKKPGTKTPSTPPVDLPSRAVAFKVNRTSGGFEITGNSDLMFNPNPIQVKVAYETRNGDAFKEYQAFDFKIGEGAVQVVPTNATIQTSSDNMFIFLPTNADYSVKVMGFDEKRDLQVQARTIRTEND